MTLSRDKLHYLNSFNILECKKAISILQRKVKEHEANSLVAKVKKKSRDGNFLDMHLEEFDLLPQTRNLLLENEIVTVRDLTEIGLNNLISFRRFGEGRIKEIRRVVFENEVDYL